MSNDQDDLKIGDEVIYKGQQAVITDHFGFGNYEILLDGEWESVHRSQLTLEENGETLQ